MNINQYFRSVESELQSCPSQTSLDFHSEIIDTNFGYFKASISFYNNSKLFLFELVEITNGKPHVEKYRYHYQDAKEKLIFRWDNAPHFPKLKSFPDHLHIGRSIRESARPSIQDVLVQAIKNIENQ
jgi:hypothetical protein